MIALADQNIMLKKLTKRRDVLRGKLRDHFSRPFNNRDYHDFELIVDELDQVRQKINALKVS